MKVTKKFIRACSLCLLLAGAGMASSCDSDTISQIINILIGGQTYTYTGTATLQCLGNRTEAGYAELSKGTSNNMQVQLTTSTIGATASLVIPSIKVGDVQLGPITLSQLQISPNEAQTQSIISINETTGYGIAGSFTYSGKTDEASALYLAVNKNYATASTLSLELTVYYGDDTAEALNFTYSGKIVSQ